MANPGAIIFSNDPRKGMRNIAWQMLKRVTSYYVISLSLATDCFSNKPATLPRFMDTRWGSIDIYFLSLKSLRPFFPAWAEYRHIVVPLEEKSALIKSMEYLFFLFGNIKMYFGRDTIFSSRGWYFRVDIFVSNEIYIYILRVKKDLKKEK